MPLLDVRRLKKKATSLFKEKIRIAEMFKGCLPYRESADKVVLHTGKYEELIVCSHEIAASTAQLVAASKVGVTLHFKEPRVMCIRRNKAIVKEVNT